MIIKPVQNLISAFYQDMQPSEYAEESTIGVNEVVAKAVLAYEKIRNIVDYRDEHLLRKSAINRICKRRFSETLRGAQIGEHLIKELIRAGYVANNSLPETKSMEIDAALNKTANLYLGVKESLSFKQQKKIKNWLLGLVAVEIEEILVPTNFKRAMVNATYAVAKTRIEILDDKMSDDEKDLQLFVGVQRSLYKSDNDMIAYSLLKLFYPNWYDAPDIVFEEIRIKILEIKKLIDYHVNHRLRRRIESRCKPYSVYSYMIKDIIEQNPDKAEEILDNPDMAKEYLKVVIAKKKKFIKSRLNKSIFRSMIYIFLTKMLLALAIEVPFEYFILEELNYVPLLINLFVPILLLLIIGKTLVVSSNKNAQKILADTYNFIYGQIDQMKKTVIKPPRNWGAFRQVVFGLFYLCTYVITFGAIFWGLRELEFNIVSGALFIMFFSIVSFFGYRLRQGAKEIYIVKERQGFLSALIEFFFMPIIKVGQWISTKFSRINIFIFILDFIIAAPFNIIIDVIDDWFAFLKEKKEEIY